MHTPIPVHHLKETGKENRTESSTPKLLRCPPVAFDIGGTLAKIVFWGTHRAPMLPSYFVLESPMERLPLTPNEEMINIYQKGEQVVLKFVKFPVHYLGDFLKHLEEHGIHIGDHRVVNATGEGTRKYSQLFLEIGTKFLIRNEVQSIIKGMNFLLLNNSEKEIFSYLGENQTFVPSSRLLNESRTGVRFPYLLVNIGSGVSIFKVESETNFTRISGSSIGGGTFFGLSKLLSDENEFKQVLLQANRGNNLNVDLKVGDIYGQAYSSIGLSSEKIASFFGRVPRMKKKTEISSADCIRASLSMVAINIAQIAFLNAQFHNVSSIFFCGSFLRGNPLAWERLSWAIDFWSEHTMEAMFLRHDGYLGALGAMLCGSEESTPGPSLSDIISGVNICGEQPCQKELTRARATQTTPSIQEAEFRKAYNSSEYFDVIPSQSPELHTFMNAYQSKENGKDESSRSTTSCSPKGAVDVFEVAKCEHEHENENDSDEDTDENEKNEYVSYSIQSNRYTSTEDDFIDIGMLVPPHPNLQNEEDEGTDQNK